MRAVGSEGGGDDEDGEEDVSGSTVVAGATELAFARRAEEWNATAKRSRVALPLTGLRRGEEARHGLVGSNDSKGRMVCFDVDRAWA